MNHGERARRINGSNHSSTVINLYESERALATFKLRAVPCTSSIIFTSANAYKLTGSREYATNNPLWVILLLRRGRWFARGQICAIKETRREARNLVSKVSSSHRRRVGARK